MNGTPGGQSSAIQYVNDIYKILIIFMTGTVNLFLVSASFANRIAARHNAKDSAPGFKFRNVPTPVKAKFTMVGAERHYLLFQSNWFVLRSTIRKQIPICRSHSLSRGKDQAIAGEVLELFGCAVRRPTQQAVFNRDAIIEELIETAEPLRCPFPEPAGQLGVRASGGGSKCIARLRNGVNESRLF